MLNVKRYFQHDVVLPMHMELVDQYGKQIGLTRHQLISREDEARLQEINESLRELLQQLNVISPAAERIFAQLNQRLDFMWWMLDFIMEAEDPSVQHGYTLRKKQDQSSVRPTYKQTSEIGPLMVGLYDAIDDYIVELSAVMESAAETRAFSYVGLSQKRFDDMDYIANLDELAQSGILPAKLLMLMIEKLNLQALVLEKLKIMYRKTSSSESWKHYQINLSPKGFSFFTNDVFTLFSKMDIYMDVEGERLVCRGKVVAQEVVEQALLDTRVDIEFDLLTGEQEQTIIRFIQHNELKACMQQVPEPYVSPFSEV